LRLNKYFILFTKHCFHLYRLVATMVMADRT